MVVLTLISKDNKAIEVEKEVFLISDIVDSNLDHSETINVAISSRVISFINDFCTYHYNYNLYFIKTIPNEDKCIISHWDREFLKRSIEDFFLITIAAHILRIKSLIQMCHQTISNMIQNDGSEVVWKILDRIEADETIKKNIKESLKQ